MAANDRLDDWGMPESRNSPFLHHDRLLLSSILLGLASFLSTRVKNEPRSTYICPSSSYGSLIVPFLQLLGLFAQAFIIVKVALFSKKPNPDVASELLPPRVILGSVLVVSSKN